MTDKNEKVTEEKVTEKTEIAEKKTTALTTASRLSGVILAE